MDKRKVKKFQRICNELAELMEEIHEINPEVMLFFAGECVTSAMLVDMKGKGYDWWRHNQTECIIAEAVIPHSDCGGI